MDSRVQGFMTACNPYNFLGLYCTRDLLMLQQNGYHQHVQYEVFPETGVMSSYIVYRLVSIRDLWN
jgi:hypothetical protein